MTALSAAIFGPAPGLLIAFAGALAASLSGFVAGRVAGPTVHVR